MSCKIRCNRGCGFVGLASFVASWVGGIGRWSVMARGDLVEMKTSKEVVRIFLKVSTGLSLNSYVNCKNKYL